MFKRIRQSLVIEQALVLWGETHVPVKAHFGNLPFALKAELREWLRQQQSLDAGLKPHDVASLLVVPLLQGLDRESLEQIGGQVTVWWFDKLVRDDVHSRFRRELSKYLVK